jgi:hypothetical protein
MIIFAAIHESCTQGWTDLYIENWIMRQWNIATLARNPVDSMELMRLLAASGDKVNRHNPDTRSCRQFVGRPLLIERETP